MRRRARVFARRRERALAVGRLCRLHGLDEDGIKRAVWRFLPTEGQDMQAVNAIEELQQAEPGKDLLSHFNKARAWLRADKEVVLMAVAQQGSALRHAAGWLRADRKVVLAAVAQDGTALKHAADWLRADREVVLAAVTRFGSAFRYAAECLRADWEVAYAAMAQDRFAAQFALPPHARGRKRPRAGSAVEGKTGSGSEGA